MAEVYAYCTLSLRIHLTQPWGDDITAKQFRAASVDCCRNEVQRLIGLARDGGVMASVEGEISVGSVVSKNAKAGGGSDHG